MEGIQIFLVLLGVITVVGSFVFSDLLEKIKDADGGSLAGLNEENIRKKIDEVVENTVENAVDDMVEARLEKTEAQLEKMSNEKILAVNDYSENVLAEINKNHEEVMFLYGMLNDKETDIKNTVKDVEAVKKSVKVMKEELTTENNLAEEPVSSDSSRLLEQSEEDERTVSESEIFISNQKELKSNNRISEEKMLVNQNVESPISEDNVKEFRISVQQEKRGVAIKAGSSSRNNNQKILDLFAQGKTNVEIAKELGLGIGEVRLVIDLYKNRRSTRD